MHAHSDMIIGTGLVVEALIAGELEVEVWLLAFVVALANVTAAVSV